MADLDPIYQNLPKEYKCENCGESRTPPMHCGHPMHLEELDSGVEWVCWMGASCGHKDAELCDDTSIKVHPTVNP